MAIARCRECGGEVSSEAVVCPHCGIRDPAVAVAAGRGRHAQAGHAEPVRRRGGKAGWVVAFLLLLVLLALFGLWYGNVVDFN